MWKRIWEVLSQIWVFLIAGAAVIVSTAVLAAGITVAHSADLGALSQAGMPAANLPPGPDTVKNAGVFEMPDYLLAFDERYSDPPSPKDITAGEASRAAVKMFDRIFDADLNGYLCSAYFYNTASTGMEDRGIWDLVFRPAASSGAWNYSATVDSVSGMVENVTRFGGASDRPAEKTYDDPALRQYEEAALSLTEERLLGEREITDVRSAAPSEFDGMTIRVAVFLDDGSGIEFGFYEEAGLSYVSFYDADGLEQMSMAAGQELNAMEAPAAEPMPTALPDTP